MHILKQDTSDFVEPATDPSIAFTDISLAARAKNVLTKHYPGWCWYVSVPPGQGVIIVRNLDLNPRGQYGFSLHKDRVSRDFEMKVMFAGGELLERWRAKRAAFNPQILEGRIMALEKPDK